MKLTPRLQLAIYAATRAHDGQTRKGMDMPYIAHPYSVAIILSEYTENEDVIIAGLLHDVLEDVDSEIYGLLDMERDFGSQVVGITQEVSEDKDSSMTDEGAKLSWRRRKEKYLDHLAVASKGALLVCAADKLHNVRALLDDYQVYGSKLWQRFNAPPAEQAWYYTATLELLRAHLDNPIVGALEAPTREFVAIINKYLQESIDK